CLGKGDDGHVEEGRDASWHHAHVPVGGGAAHEDEVGAAELLDGGGEGLRGLEVIDALEFGAGDEDAFIGAHGERVLDGIAGGVGAEGDNGDLPATIGFV